MSSLWGLMPSVCISSLLWLHVRRPFLHLTSWHKVLSAVLSISASLFLIEALCSLPPLRRFVLLLAVCDMCDPSLSILLMVKRSLLSGFTRVWYFVEEIKQAFAALNRIFFFLIESSFLLSSTSGVASDLFGEYSSFLFWNSYASDFVVSFLFSALEPDGDSDNFEGLFFTILGDRGIGDA